MFQAAQAVGTTFKTTDYTATAAATDMASAVFNAAAGVGRAFATTYTATANAIDNASGVFNRARGAAQSFAQNYTATMTTIHRTIHEFGGNVAAGATSAASSGKTTGGFNRPKAYGGFEARRFGSGGLDLANAHQPEFATASSEYWRIWKEPETGGESYIPHANDRRRPHALRVLEQTAALMGRRVIENNQGNFLGRAPVISTPGTVVVVQKGAVQLGVEVNQVDDQRIIDASRRAGEALVASMTSQLEGVR